MNIEKILGEFRREIENIYGDRLEEIILYGSHARGDATPNSDIDLLVVLRGTPGQEIDRMIDSSSLNLKHNVLISVVPVSKKEYERPRSPLLKNARREAA